MSMRDYSFVDYGIVLSEDILKCVAQKTFEDFNEEEWNGYPYGYIEDLFEKYGLGYNSEFTGDAVLVDDAGDDDWSCYESYDSDAIYYLPVGKMPSFFTCAYKNMDELIKEFKNSDIGKKLPDDFDFRGNFRHIVGTYFG